MRNKRPHASQNSLFLMELIMAIFFFVLASAVCVQAFAQAHLISRQTENEQLAVRLAENAAAHFTLHPGDEQALLAGLDTATLEDNAIVVYYDADGQPCAKDIASVMLHMDLSREENLATANIAISPISGDKPLYTLSVTRYIPTIQGGA